MSNTTQLARKVKLIIGYVLATIIIVLALLVSGIRLLLTTADIYHKDVEQLAQSLIQQPVKIGSLDAELSGFVPILVFRDVEISSDKTGKPVFQLSRVDVGLSLDAFLWQQELIPSYFVIKGIDLNIRKKVDGSISVDDVDLDAVSGTTNQQKSANILDKILSYSDLAIKDSNITWHDEQFSRVWEFNDVNISLKNLFDRHQVSADFNLPGELGNSISVDADLYGDFQDVDSTSGRMLIETTALNLMPLKPYLPSSFDNKLNRGTSTSSIWLSWEKGGLNKIHGEVELLNLRFGDAVDNNRQLEKAQANFKVDINSEENWQLSVDNLHVVTNGKIWPETNLIFSRSFTSANAQQIRLKTSYLNLEAISEIAISSGMMSFTHSEMLSGLGLRGDVTHLELEWVDDKFKLLDTKYANLAFQDSKYQSQWSGLTGHIHFENDAGTLSIVSDNAKLVAPKLFRQPVTLDKLVATAEVNYIGQDWFVTVDKVIAENDDLQSLTQATFTVPEKGSAYLDLQSQVAKMDASRLSTYYPTGIMSPELVRWLDRSILGGNIKNGVMVFNGELDAFPFRKNEGALKVSFDVDDFAIDYQQGWPVFKDAKTSMVFSHKGMRADVMSGTSLGNQVFDSFVRVDSFDKAEVKVSMQARSDLHDAAAYIINSPILPNAKQVVSDMRLSGVVNTKMDMNVPLAESLHKETTYKGKSVLSDNSVFMAKDKIDVTRLNGTINFDESGQHGKNLSAKIFGDDATLKIDSLKDVLRVSGKGLMTPGKVMARFTIPGADQYIGSSDWTGKIDFPRKGSKQQWPVMSVKSDLHGVECTLPDSFAKTKNSKRYFYFENEFTPNHSNNFKVVLGENYSVVLRIDNSREKARLVKGAVSFSPQQATMPGNKVLNVSGAISKLSLSNWFTSLGLDKSKEPQTFISIPVKLKLDELNIYTDKEAKEPRVFAPKHYPLMSGIINNFSYNEIKVGKVDFSSSRNSRGIQLDELVVVAPNMNIVGNGQWSFRNNKHNTMLDLTLSTGDFGNMLKELGFAAIVEDGEAQARGKIYWKGAPQQFTLDRLNGKIQMKVEDGTINEVEPGAGRLLGLFSLSALPRKLIGDFKGIFKSGFGFDSAFGDVEIDDGNAYTDDFYIISPVADITLSGRMGLAARDYDQRLLVVPEVGSTVSGVVALLVNLPAGIGLWLVDKLTGEQLDESATREYEITGSWDKPVITQITESQQ